MRNSAYPFVLLCSKSGNLAERAVRKPAKPDMNLYQRALAYGMRVNTYALNAGVQKNPADIAQPALQRAPS